MTRLTKAGAGASVVVIAFAGLAFMARTWRTAERVERVDVRGTRLIGRDELLTRAQVAPGMTFGSVDLAGVRRRVAEHPLVHTATVGRDHGTLVIDIAERTPAARVVVNGQVRMVDGDGVLFPQQTSAAALDLPLVMGVMNAGDTIGAAALPEALAILKAADRHGVGDVISVLRRDGDGTFWIETTLDAAPVRVGSAQDVDEKCDVLHAFLPHLGSGTRRAEYVDVRFHDQVVVKWIVPAAAPGR